ncbi:MAG: hydrolase, partial [Burkholderiales bacterium PBB5]
APAQPPAAGLFFDDFSHADAAALVQRGGWRLRDAPGHPGVPGARWAPEGLSLVDDPGQPGNRLLLLTASTDGTAAGTRQAQLCHARKLLHGTYAARIRFTDSPRAGAAGDPVVQTFYTVAPLAHDFDPRFSEVDWEYLPNGGWGSPAPRLYGISWQTVRLDPWQAHNSAHEAPGRLGGQGAEGASDGWHLLGMVVTPEAVEMFLDGQRLATHSGRQVPVQPMAVQFNLWFSPGGLGPASAEARVWVQEVDWVFHAAG